MEYRRDLEFSVPAYLGSPSYGLLTLGDKKTITMSDGRRLELLPYLIETHTTRGVGKQDPRRRRRNENAIPLLAEAYAEHYNNAGLDEHWTKEEAEAMMLWHMGQSLGRLFFIKWARDMQTGEEFPIGFFSAYSKPYTGGKILWDGELFVLPEYRRLGIATELVEAVFQVAADAGIDLFEALTYEDKTGQPMKMWEKFGAQGTDLIHIVGEVNSMLDTVQTLQDEKRQGR